MAGVGNLFPLAGRLDSQKPLAGRKSEGATRFSKGRRPRGP